MFDRYEVGEQSVLVHISFSPYPDASNKNNEDLQEFESLVFSAGVEVLKTVTGSRKVVVTHIC